MQFRASILPLCSEEKIAHRFVLISKNLSVLLFPIGLLETSDVEWEILSRLESTNQTGEICNKNYFI
jgi:hypothetical protein